MDSLWDMMNSLYVAIAGESPLDKRRREELEQQRRHEVVETKSVQSLKDLRSLYAQAAAKLAEIDREIESAEVARRRAVVTKDRSAFRRVERALAILRGTRNAKHKLSESIYSQISSWESRQDINAVGKVTSGLHETARLNGVSLADNARQLADVLEDDAEVDDEIDEAFDAYVQHGNNRIDTLVGDAEIDSGVAAYDDNAAWDAAMLEFGVGGTSSVSAPAIVVSMTPSSSTSARRTNEDDRVAALMRRMPSVSVTTRTNHPRGPQQPPSAQLNVRSNSSPSSSRQQQQQQQVANSGTAMVITEEDADADAESVEPPMLEADHRRIQDRKQRSIDRTALYD